MRKEGVFFREERTKGLLENVNLVYGNLATDGNTSSARITIPAQSCPSPTSPRR